MATVYVDMGRGALEIEAVTDVRRFDRYAIVVRDDDVEYLIPYANVRYLRVEGITLDRRLRAAQNVPGDPNHVHMVDVVERRPR